MRLWRLPPKAKDEADIKALEQNFVAAVKAKDSQKIMSLYAPGEKLFVFDVVPPRQYTGSDAYKKDWERSLRTGSGASEH
jgi:ketosteroid isomerase-like protein